MGERVTRTPGGEWMTGQQAREYLGLPRAQLRRLVRHGAVHARGKGQAQRYRAEDVAAVAVLWECLDRLLPPPDPSDVIADEDE